MTVLAPQSTRFTEVLVASDFCQEADRALSYAKAIARTSDAELLLVHVAQPVSPVVAPEGVWVDDPSFLERAADAAEAAGINLRAEGLKAKSVCRYGGVVEEIACEAKEHKADLVVVGTHGRKGLARLFAGSQAEGVANELSVPVVIIGPRCSPWTQQEWRPRGILCSISLDPEGAAVVAYASRLAHEYGATLAVAYQEGNARDMHYADWLDFKRAVAQILPRHEATSRPAMHAISLDEPAAETLVDLAIARDCDLLVMGIHHRLFTWPSLGAGKLPRVLAEAPCPVMTVPTEKSR